MSLAAAVLDAMLAAGCTAEQIVAAVKADLAGDERKADEKRAKDAERQRKSRINRGLSRGVTVTPCDKRDVPVALSPSPNENNSNPHPHTHPDNNHTREDPNFHVLAWIEFCKKPMKAGKAKPPHRMPDGWMPVLTEAAQKIVDGWPPGYFDQQAAAFRDHAADKGRTSKDWQAAFRTWITNANRWKPANDRSPPNGRNSAQPDRRSSLARAIDEGLDWLG